VLRGRGDECRRLERLLDSARGGTSAMLVIRGEAGVGKTALLDYVAERASDCRVVRASGVESEMGYPFAALLQLLRAPILRNLEQLAPPQRDALRRAFGLMEGPPPQTYLVGLATLTMLSRLAGERPLVCLVDDVQWLDRESLAVLSFVVRRLAAEPIVVFFGCANRTSRSFPACPTSSSPGSPRPTPASSSTKPCREASTSRFATASWPRRGATRSRFWNCRAG